MNTSVGFSSLTSSDEYIQITPEEVSLYYLGNPDQILINLPAYGGKSPISCLRLTTGDIIKIMEKIEKLVMESPEGMKHKLNKMFGEEKKQRVYSLIPGTLRIFGPELACFWTGRGWRKIRLNKSEG
jgi:hypothetical protein